VVDLVEVILLVEIEMSVRNAEKMKRRW